MNTETSAASTTPADEPSSSGAPAAWWGQIGLLWLMLTPLAVAIYTLLLPIAPNDFWYNARAGAHIAATGSIPATALFTTSLPPATPYFNQAWLSQLLLFRTLEFAGLSGIVLLRSFGFTAAFAVIGMAAWRRASRLNMHESSIGTGAALENTTRARLTAAATLLTLALSASNMDARPQMFSVPFFAVFVFCLLEWPYLCGTRRNLAIAFLATLTLLWANFHGAFISGLILLGALLTGDVLQFFLAKRSTKLARLFGSVSRRSILETATLFALAIAAALVNPRGTELYSYVFKLAALQAGQKYIQEWQAPDFSQWYGVLFFAALALTLIVAGVLLRRLSGKTDAWQTGTNPQLGLRLGEVFIFGAVSVMALRDVRSIIWFALFLAPALSALATRALQERKTSSVAVQAAPIPRAAQIANAVIAILLLFSIVPFLPQLRMALPLPAEYFRQFAPTPRGAFPYGFEDDPPFLLERDTPVEAVAYLRAHPLPGRIWNDMVFGSYLTWAGFPELLPHADPRVEMYPLEFWEEYARLLSGPIDAASTLQAQNFSAALLHRKDGKRLLQRLQNDGWRVVSQQRDAVLLFAPDGKMTGAKS